MQAIEEMKYALGHLTRAHALLAAPERSMLSYLMREAVNRASGTITRFLKLWSEKEEPCKPHRG